MANPDDEKRRLNYAPPPRGNKEREAWVGLIITLAFCLAIAAVELLRRR